MPCFISSIRPKTFFGQTAIFIIDFKGYIYNISSGCIQMFGINLEKLKDYKYISDIFPGLFEIKEEFMGVFQKEVPSDIINESPIRNFIEKSLVLEIEEIKISLISKAFYSLNFKFNDS